MAPGDQGWRWRNRHKSCVLEELDQTGVLFYPADYGLSGEHAGKEAVITMR
ncbi:MAG: hypothetical protein ACLTW9_30325 [Enterocloster sp.]